MLTIYKASAGSGKTFTLAYTYIKSLLGVKTERGTYVLNMPKYAGARCIDYAHSHILAITFTNKATAEMKSRIIKELDRLSRIPIAGNDTPYAGMLIKDFGCSRDEIAQVASRALHRVLYDYNNFNVSTIDSFFQTILRSFAREIDRQGDYRVELNDSIAVDTAVSMLFDEVNGFFGNPDPAVVNWLKDTAEECWAQGNDFNPFNRMGSVFSRITSFVKKSFAEDFKVNDSKISKYLQKPGALQAFAARLKECIAADKDVIVKEATLLLDTFSKFNIDTTKVNNSILKLVNRAAGDKLDNKDINNILDKDTDTKYLQALNDHDYDKYFKKNYDAPIDVCQAIDRWFDLLKSTLLHFSIYSKMSESLIAFKALSYISEYINRFRQENNLILITDTNTLIGSIIAGSETPFIYERVGVSLRHFLIDEFQDTSVMQWNNIKPLIANSLAEGHDNLIIGDVKQSIYRWRGGEASLLDHQVQDVDFPSNSLVKGDKQGENTNYRSAADIVRFNNTIFKQLAAAGNISGYAGVAQSIKPDNYNLNAYITISEFCTDQLDAISRDFSEAERKACLSADDTLIPVNVSIVQCGKAILAEHDRGYAWKDIAVLCRRNSEATLVAELFAKLFPDIQLISDEALIVGHASSVRLVVSILRMLDTASASDTHSASNTPSPSAAVSSLKTDVLIDRFEYFLAQGKEPGSALRDALASDTSGTSMRGDLDAILAEAPASLPTLVEAIIAHKIAPDLRAAELPYINAFVDTVIEFSANYIPTIHSFLDYWDSVSNTLAIGAPEDADAVTIMTIHKAKGLEWDCVHIPILNWEFIAAPEAGWFSLDNVSDIDPNIRPPVLYLRPNKFFTLPGSPFAAAVNDAIAKDSADNLNVVYVAFTRAVRELHVGIIPKRDESIISYLKEALNTNSDHDDIFIDLSQGVLEPGTCNYRLGEPTTPVKGSSSNASVSQLDAAPFNVTFTAVNSAVTRVEDITMSLAAGPDIDDDNVNDNNADDRNTADEHAAEATRRGTDMHAILAQIIGSNDLDDAIRRIVGDDAERAADYRAVISDAFARQPDEVNRWFGNDTIRVLNEQTIFDTGHNCNFRPDRIVWTADGHIDVIDFKFTTDTNDEHRQQVKAYVSMLVNMGYEDVRGYLWYLLRNEIVQA